MCYFKYRILIRFLDITTLSTSTMSFLIYITTAVISFHVANTYVLLTANLDDFNTIAKQIAASPVGDQINKIIRRASSVFNEQVKKSQTPATTHNKRSNDDKMDVGGHSFEVWKPNQPDGNSASDTDSLSENDEEYLKNRKDNAVERRNGDDDVVALGKNASFYLQSIKKIFENF